MNVLKIVIWFFIDLLGFRHTVEKYFPTALDIFLTMDAIADVINHGVKAMRDGKLDKEERLKLYRAVMDDTLVDIIEHLQEDNDAEDLTDLNS